MNDRKYISASEYQSVYDQILERLGATEGGDNDMFMDVNGRCVRITVDIE